MKEPAQSAIFSNRSNQALADPVTASQIGLQVAVRPFPVRDHGRTGAASIIDRSLTVCERLMNDHDAMMTDILWERLSFG